MNTFRRFVAGVLPLAVALFTACSDQPPTSPRVPRIEAAKGGSGGGDPTVDAIDPTNAPQDTTLDVRVFGTNFDRDSRADLALDGAVSEKVKTNRTRFVSSKELIANVTIATDALTGLYDVIVTVSSGKKGIGTEMFEVKQKGNKLIAPYNVTDLGEPEGDTHSEASGMNEAGKIVGSSWNRRDPFNGPVLWTVDVGGVTVNNLEMPPNAAYAAARAITEFGIAVGPSSTGAVYWDAGGGVHSLPGGGSVKDVTVLQDDTTVAVGSSSGEAVYWVIGGSPDLDSRVVLPRFRAEGSPSADAVNSAGTIAGWTSGLQPPALLWHKDSQGNYGVCELFGDSFPYAISEPTTDGHVHVAGARNVSVSPLATIWTVDPSQTTWSASSPQPCSITNVRGLDFTSEFFDVNARGDAVGMGDVSHQGILLPALSEVPLYLPPLTNGGSSTARAISEDGSRIAGRSSGAKNTNRAVLWTRQ